MVIFLIKVILILEKIGLAVESAKLAGSKRVSESTKIVAEIAIKITNLPQIKAAFGKAPQLMTRELNLAIRKTIYTIQRGEFRHYQSLGIRVITRGLYSSIERGTWFGNLKGEVGPNVQGSPGVGYAGFVHSGTRYMKARPFLLNAVNSSQKETEMNFTKAVDNVLNKIGKMT